MIKVQEYGYSLYGILDLPHMHIELSSRLVLVRNRVQYELVNFNLLVQSGDHAHW